MQKEENFLLLQLLPSSCFAGLHFASSGKVCAALNSDVNEFSPIALAAVKLCYIWQPAMYSTQNLGTLQLQDTYAFFCIEMQEKLTILFYR